MLCWLRAGFLLWFLVFGPFLLGVVGSVRLLSSGGRRLGRFLVGCAFVGLVRRLWLVGLRRSGRVFWVCRFRFGSLRVGVSVFRFLLVGSCLWGGFGCPFFRLVLSC